MRRRLPAWLLLLLLAAVCAGIIALAARWRSRQHSAGQLLARLPAEDAVLVYIDFAVLRQAGVLGILEGSDLIQEPEYRAFREGSGFDYLRDLDWVLASLGPEGSYFLLRGRFRWSTLNRYVTEQGGTCRYAFCRVAGSAPDRSISYFPMASNLLALGVGRDAYAAYRLQEPNPGTRPGTWPAQPVWFFVPATRLRRTEALPSGARLLAQALEATEGVLLSAGLRGQQMEVALEVACRSGQDAEALATQLRQVTALLRESIAAEKKQPDPRDLSGVLTSGVFESKERTVHGRWPLERAFLEAMAGGAQ